MRTILGEFSLETASVASSKPSNDRGYEVLISAINRDGFGWKLPLDVIPAVAAQATVDATSTGLFHGLQLRLVNR